MRTLNNPEWGPAALFFYAAQIGALLKKGVLIYRLILVVCVLLLDSISSRGLFLIVLHVIHYRMENHYINN